MLAAETRSKLLESAQKMFAEKGYKGTSVRMINRSIGLADGILYHYFPGGKKEIFKAVLRNHITQIMDALEDRGKIKEYTRMPLENDALFQRTLSMDAVSSAAEDGSRRGKRDGFRDGRFEYEFYTHEPCDGEGGGGGNSKLEDPGWRKRLIDYQVELWMAPQEKKKTDNRKER